MTTLFHIALYEITRLLQSRRGWLSILAFVLVWAVIFRFAIWPASAFLRRSGDSPFLAWLLDRLNASEVTLWSVPELGVYWYFSIVLLPWFCVVLMADQTASDRARGTLRFLHLRATRWQIYFGRLLGQLLLMLVLILITVLSTLIVAAYHDAAVATPGLQHISKIVPHLMLAIMPFAALMALLSILSGSARQAILIAMIGWIIVSFTLWLLQSRLALPTSVGILLQWVLPGSQLSILRAMQLPLNPVVYWVPLIQTLLLLGAGAWVARRIDL